MNNYNAQILVTGGTGFLGSYLLRQLLESGYTRIKALHRSTSTFDLVADIQDRIEWVECDLLDIIGLEDAMQGVQQVYHCAAMVSMQPRDYKRMIVINRESTANIANLCLELGVEKLVHVSSIAAVGKNKNIPVSTENNKWERGHPISHYAISKYQAEQEVWRAAAEGLNVAIINPSVILGSGRWHEGALPVFRLGWKQSPFYPLGTNGFVDVRDVARFMVQLMESDIEGQRYILSENNYAFKDIQHMIARALGKRTPIIGTPQWMLHLAAFGDALWSALTRNKALITREVAIHASHASLFSNEKSKRDLSFEYTPIKETIEAAAKVFLEEIRKGN